jgi:hypothetical protein
MEGIRIRSGRFTEDGARMLDLSLGAEPIEGASSFVVYPHLIPRLVAKVPGAAQSVLLLRMTSWDGEMVGCLFEPEAAAFHGCGGCLVDLTSGYGDAVEIESLRILAASVQGAHPLGLPVVCRIILNAEMTEPEAASYLDVHLTIAEEMGADCLVFPCVEDEVLKGLRKPLIPYFLTVETGFYERGAP